MKNLYLGMASGMLLIASQSAFAVPIAATTSVDAGANFTTSGVASFSTNGDNMDGMTIDVVFANGSTDSGVWGTTGATAGGASGTGWGISLTGNTNTDPFVFSNTGSLDIVRLILDGRPGDTVFDFTLSPSQTPGSSVGGNIGNNNGLSQPPVDGPSGLAVHGTYRNQVALNNTFYGDLYTVLDISLSTATGGGLAGGSTLTFYTDTDNVAVKGDIVPAPAPSILALLGIGLVGMGFARRGKTA